MFEGADDGGLMPHRPGRLRARRASAWWCGLGEAVLWAVLVLLTLHGLARAQGVALTSCSQTVGASSAAVPFPASGGGPPRPTSYLEIWNAHASNNLGVNFTGGTAAIGAAGTATIFPGGFLFFVPPNVPVGVSVIGSGAGTTTACGYR